MKNRNLANMMKAGVLSAVLVSAALFSSCEKDDPAPEPPTPPKPPVEKVDTVAISIASMNELHAKLPDIDEQIKLGKALDVLVPGKFLLKESDYSALDSLHRFDKVYPKFNLKFGSDFSIAPADKDTKLTSAQWNSWKQPAISANGELKFIDDEEDIPNFGLYASFISVDQRWRTSEFSASNADELAGLCKQILASAENKKTAVVFKNKVLPILNKHVPSIASLAPVLDSIDFSGFLTAGEYINADKEFVQAFANVIKFDENIASGALFAVSGANGANDLIGLKDSLGNPVLLGTDTIDCGRKGSWAAFKTQTFFPKILTVKDNPVNATDVLQNLFRYKSSGLRGDLVFHSIDGALGGMAAFVPATAKNGENGDSVFDMIRTKSTSNKQSPFTTKNQRGEIIDPVIATYDWIANNARNSNKTAIGNAEILDMDISRLQFGTYGTENGSMRIVYESGNIANGGDYALIKNVPYFKLSPGAKIKFYIYLSQDPMYRETDYYGEARNVDVSGVAIRVPAMLGFGSFAPNNNQDYELRISNPVPVRWVYEGNPPFLGGMTSDESIKADLIGRKVFMEYQAQKVMGINSGYIKQSVMTPGK